jgi:putative transposase
MDKAYRYRFYPTAEQEHILRCTLGCVRLVYNKALHERMQGWYFGVSAQSNADLTAEA